MAKKLFTIQCTLAVLLVISSNKSSLALDIEQRPSICSEFKYQCDDGSCIADSEKCDGVRNCADGSDETGEVCRDVKCPRFAFRCTYGACIKGTSECDNVVDCIDQSDELSINCQGIKELIYSKANCSTSHSSFQCNSGQCIDAHHVCNGVQDCYDKSDETVLICSSFFCPQYAFRCSYGACVSGSLICNGVKDCVDGSDESYILCSSHKLTSTTRRPNAKPEGCIVPSIENGLVFNKYRVPILPGQRVKNEEKIFYKCHNSLLDQGNSSHCIDGTFRDGIRKCIRGCLANSLLKSSSLQTECVSKDLEQISCTEMLYPATEVKITCNPGYRMPKDGFVARIQCKDDGKWSQGLVECEPICGDISESSSKEYILGENKIPWLAMIYKNPESELHFCHGSVVGPYAILAAAHCFFDKEKNVLQSPELFSVKVGQSASIRVTEIRPFLDYDGLWTLHEGDIAIVRLEQALIFEPTVQPVCMDIFQSAKEERIDERRLFV